MFAKSVYSEGRVTILIVNFGCSEDPLFSCFLHSWYLCTETCSCLTDWTLSKDGWTPFAVHFTENNSRMECNYQSRTPKSSKWCSCIHITLITAGSSSPTNNKHEIVVSPNTTSHRGLMSSHVNLLCSSWTCSKSFAVFLHFHPGLELNLFS